MKRGITIAALLIAGAAAIAVVGVAIARTQSSDAGVATAAIAAPAGPPALADSEIANLRLGLDAARRGEWFAVDAAKAAARDPLARRILTWRFASDRASPATFEEVAAALAEFPGWPARETMRRRAEQQIFDSAAEAVAQIAFLTQENGPLTGDGQVALARAYRRLGRTNEANALAREVWRYRTLTPRAEAILTSEFSGALTAADAAARADALLWRDDAAGAARLAPRLTGTNRKLIDARVALQRRPRRGLQAVVDAANAVAPNDPGLLFDRARYIRRSGRPEDALPIAARIDASKAPDFARPAIAEERRLYISRALRQGDKRSAYRLAATHGLSSGVEFADSEWLAGWISLRFMNDPASAKRHFEKLSANVSAPVSRARALYWRAQAERALGQDAAADTLLAQGAALDYTFYGQLAAQKLDPNRPLSLSEGAPATPQERAAFESREIIRALRAVGQAGTREDFESIAFYVDDQLETPLEHELLASLAREQGFARTAVRNGKAGLFRGIVATQAAYPVIALPADARRPGRPEPALIHAFIRQETEFDPAAISRAGARGLMQLMPATAQATARREGFPYERERLLSDPDYNVTLGAAHVEHLLEDWNGSYLLTIVSYNAGASRARQWIEDWGDPRSGAIDPVDWIELIPFGETRNYVMRVMENLQVYRYRLDGAKARFALEQDLKRGG